MKKWLLRGAVFLAVLAGAAVAGGWLYSRAVLPQTDGSTTVSGLGAPVHIERDAEGIPTIRGASRDDVLFGLGYAHAQDRLWQLETHKRIGSGRIAKAFGSEVVDTDRFLRVLGVRHAADAQWVQLGDDGRSALTAYAAGVNAFVRESMRARPPEFLLLGVSPEDWQPQDSLAWMIMMAWDLGGNWQTELLRMRLALNLPVDRVNEAIPPYVGDVPLPSADYAALFRSLGISGQMGQQALRTAPESHVEGKGSNNWVVSGARSETGKPLLANDPHLKLTSPALWYFARLEAPGFRVAGATMPGVPLVVLGQNEYIAWGFTNTGPDVQDLYLERIHPDNDSQYQTPNGWAPFETEREVIKVRGAADVNLTVRRTRHGPVISDLDGLTRGLTGPGDAPTYALAMRWMALDPDPGSLVAGLAFNAATSVDEFIAHSRKYVAPMQNMVVADKDGRIGMVSAGHAPLRKPENDLHGLVPAPGWDARYDWVGRIPAEKTPRLLDPEKGWIATANQRIHDASYPYYLTSEWSPPYRQDRIEQLLAAQPRHSLDSLRNIQSDELSLAAVKLLSLLKTARSDHPLAEEALAALALFDGVMAADKAAPLIVWAWARHLTLAVFSDELGTEVFSRYAGNRNFRDALEGVLARNDSWWCDDKRTPSEETCEQQINVALGAALDELQAMQGQDVSAWRWGRAHVARAEHRPFSNVGALAKWFELSTPVGGDTYTVNVSRVHMKPTGRLAAVYGTDHAASLRALYDVADPTKSRFMHSSGQSGIVFSPWYSNFLGRWAQVKDVPVWQGDAVHSLELRPR